MKHFNLNQNKKQNNIFNQLKNILIWKIKSQKHIINFLNYIDIMFFKKIEFLFINLNIYMILKIITYIKFNMDKKV